MSNKIFKTSSPSSIRVWKKWRFSTPQIHLCLIKIWFSASRLVVKIATTIRQAVSDMRGRVSLVNSIFVNSSNELGQFESGIAARVFGTVPSVIFGGSMTLIVVAIALPNRL